MAEKEPEKMMKTMKIPEPVAKEKAENKRRTIQNGREEKNR